MVTVELSIQAANGKWMFKEIACLRPNVGEDILENGEVFEVHAIAHQAYESKVLAKVRHDSGKRLTVAALKKMGFLSIR
jgi:hypothetical protein